LRVKTVAQRPRAKEGGREEEENRSRIAARNAGRLRDRKILGSTRRSNAGTPVGIETPRHLTTHECLESEVCRQSSAGAKKLGSRAGRAGIEGHMANGAIVMEKNTTRFK
jgi:hypothetical protein